MEKEREYWMDIDCGILRIHVMKDPDEYSKEELEDIQKYIEGWESFANCIEEAMSAKPELEDEIAHLGMAMWKQSKDPRKELYFNGLEDITKNKAVRKVMSELAYIDEHDMEEYIDGYGHYDVFIK